MQAHHGMIELFIQRAAIGVHHVDLPPQIVPVLLPAIMLPDPAVQILTLLQLSIRKSLLSEHHESIVERAS